MTSQFFSREVESGKDRHLNFPTASSLFWETALISRWHWNGLTLNTVGLHHDWKERKKETKETDEKWRSRTKIFFAASSRFFVPDKKKTEFFFASVAHFFAQRFKAEPAKRRQLFEASENDEPAIFFHSRKVIFDEKVLGNFNLVQEFDISTLLRHFFPRPGRAHAPK